MTPRAQTDAVTLFLFGNARRPYKKPRGRRPGACGATLLQRLLTASRVTSLCLACYTYTTLPGQRSLDAGSLLTLSLL